MQNFKKLDIYKRAIEYCVSIYKFSSKLSQDEKFGLVSQMRRAASSISLNISEGAGCATNKEFALFVSYGYRSCNEVLTCLELTHRLNLVNKADQIKMLEEEGCQISRMIYSFYKKLDR